MSDETIFAEALGISDPVARIEYLDRVCHGDDALRASIDELLKAHSDSNPLDRIPVDLQRTGAFQPQTNQEPTATVGDRIGPYKLLEQIGEGGMGEVWVADQLEPIKRRVAIKLIKPGMDSRSVLGRFEAERQALAVMDHPNIAKVLDAGTTSDGRPYFVMELVKGTPITEFCDARKMTPKQRLELFIPVCQAIQHAHMKGIIHRDIKPSNVLVALHDELPVAKVIDFGVAKAIGQQLTEKTIYTGFGALVGTPTYMAPEQATFNQLDVDTRADVYALGVLLYELLVGSPPIEAGRLKKAALDEVLRIVRNEEPPRPSQRLSTSQTKASIAATRATEPGKLSQMMRGELDWIVMKALEKDRTRRYDTPTALAKDVQRYLSGDSVEACPPTLGYRLRKAYRKNRNPIRVCAAFAILLSCGIVASTVLAIQARDAEKKATANADAAMQAQRDADEQRQAVEKSNADLTRSADLQRRTRYAAEMNLLQSAYNDRQMNRVKSLLEAQIPKVKEVDVRGPEWHYWDRKLNGHASERVIRFAMDNERIPPSAFFARNQIAISRDGRYVAATTSLMLETGEQSQQRNFVRIWEIVTGSLLREIFLDNSEFTPSSVFFSNDGQTLEIRGFASNLDERMPERYHGTVLWDWSNKLARPRIESIRFTATNYTFSDVSDDLNIICERYQGDSAGDFLLQTKAKITRRNDGKKLYETDSDRIVRLQLLPDGKHLLIEYSRAVQADLAIASAALEAVRPNSRMQLLRMEDRRILWECDWKGRSVNSANADGISSAIDFTSDGLCFWQLDKADGHYVRKFYSLANGDLQKTVPILPETEGELLNVSDNNDSPFIERANRSTYGVKSIYGIEFMDGLTRRRVDCIDGQALHARMREDGSFVTLHVRYDKLILRQWNNPFLGSESQRQPLVQQTAPNPDHSAFLRFEYAGKPADGQPLRSPGRDCFRVLQDCEGNVRLRLPVAGENLKHYYYFDSYQSIFSRDGNHIAVGETVRVPQQPEYDRLVIYDLQTQASSECLVLPTNECIHRVYFSPRRDRLVVEINAITDREAEFPTVEEFPRKVLLLEFPSGRLISELKTPEGQVPNKTWIDDTGVYGHRINAKEIKQVDHWNSQTGEYVGKRGMTQTDANGRILKHIREVRRGGSILRSYWITPVDNRIRNNTYVVEVRRETDGEDAPPVLHIESPDCISAHLSPDGQRLLAITFAELEHSSHPWYRKPYAALYCLRTGRSLLRVSELEEMPKYAKPYRVSPFVFGYWNSQSNQFWTHVDQQGKLSGIDFRPRETK